MTHCTDCEHYHRDEQGRISFSCDPLASVKEPECLLKWQLLKINQLSDGIANVARGVAQMTAAYEATAKWYSKLPMGKLFKAMERELEDIDEAEKWKQPEEEDKDEQEDGKEDDKEDDKEQSW
jgi:hypothetical protein